MNVYLLLHHRLDPRFRYTLEREAPSGKWSLTATMTDLGELPVGFVQRQVWKLRQLLRRLRTDYDQVVHGHEQIRLSRLVLLMDQDPELTLVIPAGMTREWALQAVRGVIRSGQMAHRSHALRNVLTAIVMMVVLFGIVPTHVLAIVFYPLIGLYAWRRYREDRMIHRTMHHLLVVRLMGNGDEHFREDIHLKRLEEAFGRTAQPEVAYREATEYFDALDGKLDERSEPAHALMFKYYRDIGRLDPYERYQDRIRKKLVEAAKLAWHHLWGLWKGAFNWTFGRTRIFGMRIPNWIFVVLTLLLVDLALWGTLQHWVRQQETVPQLGSSNPGEGMVEYSEPNVPAPDDL